MLVNFWTWSELVSMASRSNQGFAKKGGKLWTLNFLNSYGGKVDSKLNLRCVTVYSLSLSFFLSLYRSHAQTLTHNHSYSLSHTLSTHKHLHARTWVHQHTHSHKHPHTLHTHTHTHFNTCAPTQMQQHTPIRAPSFSCYSESNPHSHTLLHTF